MPPIAVVVLVVVLYCLWHWHYRAAIFPVHCTECLDGRGCRGLHVQCSEPSLQAAEQERTWQELGHVSGVRPRTMPQHSTSSPDQDDTVCFILTALFIAIVGIMLYC